VIEGMVSVCLFVLVIFLRVSSWAGAGKNNEKGMRKFELIYLPRLRNI
jgi:hypothetical protein